MSRAKNIRKVSREGAKAAKAETRTRLMEIRSSVVYPGAAKRICGYSDEWYTPARIPKALGPFDLDPCAGPQSHARKNIRSPQCGLKTRWSGRVWLNPPYSNIYEWLAKFTAHKDGIILVNARPETHWFQQLANSADAVLWLKGRIHFEQPDGTQHRPPVGSVLIAFGKHNATALAKSGLPGVLMQVHHLHPSLPSPRRGTPTTSPLRGKTSSSPNE
jgi:hypothetical protein